VSSVLAVEPVTELAAGLLAGLAAELQAGLVAGLQAELVVGLRAELAAGLLAELAEGLLAELGKQHTSMQCYPCLWLSSRRQGLFESGQEWVVDSGATQHVKGNMRLLEDFVASQKEYMTVVMESGYRFKGGVW
jgi:hypothetical protein